MKKDITDKELETCTTEWLPLYGAEQFAFSGDIALDLVG